MHVLVSEKTAAHLPVCQINPMRSIHSTLKKYLTEIFGAEIPAHKVIWRVLAKIDVNEICSCTECSPSSTVGGRQTPMMDVAWPSSYPSRSALKPWYSTISMSLFNPRNSSNFQPSNNCPASGAFGVCLPDWQVLLAGDGATSRRPVDCPTQQEHDRPPCRHTLINRCLPWQHTWFRQSADIQTSGKTQFSMSFAVICNMSFICANPCEIQTWHRIDFVQCRYPFSCKVLKQGLCRVLPEKRFCKIRNVTTNSN